MDKFLATLEKALVNQGIQLSRVQKTQCVHFQQLLLTWNERVNLTAITDPREIAIKHFVDSLIAASFFNWKMPGKVLDLGSGAGFPGMVLKIWQQEREFLLVDSVKKKVDFLQRAIEELALTRIGASHDRGEDLGQNPGHREQYGIVTARAVASMATLAEYCLPLVAPEGYFYALKGPNYQEELAEAQEAIKILGDQVEDTHHYQLPITHDQRRVITIKKVQSTPGKYPRRRGIPSKRPLV